MAMIPPLDPPPVIPSREALHEAAHCVAATLFGWRVTNVNLLQTTTATAPPQQTDRDRQRIAVALSAGNVAEEIALGAAAFPEHEREEARAALEGGRHVFRDGVEAARQEARMILRARWGAVLALARALDAKGELNETEVRAICGAAVTAR